MSAETAAAARTSVVREGAAHRIAARLANPWRHRWGLEAFVWGYIAWTLVPVAVAIIFSFNAGRSRTAWQGFSLRWWYQDPIRSLLHDDGLRAAVVHSLTLSICTVAISVPLGTLFAVGIDRWRGRVATVSEFGVLLAFVIPEIALALGFFYLFSQITEAVIPRGTMAQVIGLVTWQIAFPLIIVRARLLSIGREYEEAAMDLGASSTTAVRRILLPLLAPAILVSAAIVFADSLDDFVTVRYLSSGAGTEPVSVKIYNASRAAPSLAVNAAGATILVLSLSVVGIAFIVYRSLAGRSSLRDAGGPM